ncbi:MAG: hypothetical protein ABI747_00600 [Candidatus Moraniibacteriota bacterium]
MNKGRRSNSWLPSRCRPIKAANALPSLFSGVVVRTSHGSANGPTGSDHGRVTWRDIVREQGGSLEKIRASAFCFFCYTTGMEADVVMRKMEEQDRKLEALLVSVEKTRKYFLWSMIAQLALFLLPLIGLMFAIPFFLSTFSNNLDGLL